MPCFFEDPENNDLIDIKGSYFWGDAFLVKPITESNLTDISIDLPQGVWFDYWTDKRYQGNQGQYQTMPKNRELTLLLHNWPNTIPYKRVI